MNLRFQLIPQRIQFVNENGDEILLDERPVWVHDSTTAAFEGWSNAPLDSRGG